jgi:proteasome-associated ATPase
VPTFLAEMDGMHEVAAFVMLATNRPSDLDSAVLREGRCDRKILVSRPTRDDARALFGFYLKDRPCGLEVDELAEKAVADLYDPGHVLYVVHMHDGRTRTISIGQLTSGAQIAGLVEGATGFAIDREIATGDAAGIIADDFTRAIARTLKEARELSHPAEVAAFCEDFAEQVSHVDRMTAEGRPRRASLIAPAPAPVEMFMHENRERMPRA